ncbi:DUF2147 domain-containing protein [Bradyrhizobium sp. 180]|uniref:DUF2147 domain-containing protein n=1 Tax=unclassified Bradyrhizobium TaxID=2631580 RepID=UPI001FFB0384|nr:MULTISPECIES: DUF2147 domain-containing protein [unclassified Bradyrhizobium]MCK1421308.1 DUF2147 domain-containing protein [Bradyrhizobium sp. CW12]MCK1489573.1 DUF2147 domain-containing protein [Bradyrhizobium sp. 180]MCK1526855.1 DUF2147 domain-containing protein [Bradyrhizobium sp. 182]MCK1599789.1 DUF2147 domain-containing protein [Bradyrhizobium sp. 164]MCK1617151.1 DUF2147 domain-containing protein [Bradyrhizobium sp. 159]
MFSRFALPFVVLAALLGAASAHAQSADGTWLTQAGDARVKISRCGGGICGHIVWLREPYDTATGQPATDSKNPNPALAKRPMIGLPLFSDMQPSAPNKWSGQIYNADDGSTYASSVTVTGADSLRVEGCVGALCGGETWTRAGR